MKVVVADTSPLNYLIWIGEIELLVTGSNCVAATCGLSFR
jgi:hypothetical protein